MRGLREKVVRVIGLRGEGERTRGGGESGEGTEC